MHHKFCNIGQYPVSRRTLGCSALAALFLSGCSETLKRKTDLSTGVQSPQKVIFAGLSFTGNYADNQANCPLSFAAAQAADLDGMLRKRIENRTFKGFELLIDSQGMQSTDADACAFTLAIDFETTTVSALPDNRFKVILTVYASLFFFDFHEKKVINTVPVNCEYVTLEEKRPTKKRLEALMRGLLTGELPEIELSFIDAAVKKLENVNVRSSYGMRLKVRNIDFDDRGRESFKVLKAKPQQICSLYAQLLTRSLVDRLGIAMLPYTKGQAIGAKMSGRFIDGRAFQLEIPQGDYAVDIRLYGLKTLSEENDDGKTIHQAFFVFMGLTFLQPDLNKVYFSQVMRGTGTALLLKGQKPGLRASYLETSAGLMDGFAKCIADTDGDWIDDCIPPQKHDSFRSELNALRPILEKME